MLDGVGLFHADWKPTFADDTTRTARIVPMIGFHHVLMMVSMSAIILLCKKRKRLEIKILNF